MDDVRGALARQGMSEDSVEQGDAVMFHYGWSVHWTNPSRYNDSRFGIGENERIAGFIHIGTLESPPMERPRPDAAAKISTR